jgi:hypothetical protein
MTTGFSDLLSRKAGLLSADNGGQILPEAVTGRVTWQSGREAMRPEHCWQVGSSGK